MTVVLLADGIASTAIMALEIVHAVGANDLHDCPPEPAFCVRTVFMDGGVVRSPYGIGFTPELALAEVKRIVKMTPGEYRAHFAPLRVCGPLAPEAP